MSDVDQLCQKNVCGANKLCRLLFIFCAGCFAEHLTRGGGAEHELLTLINFLRDLAAFSLNWVFNYGRLWRPGQPRSLINCQVQECLFLFNGSGVIVRKLPMEVQKLKNSAPRTFGNSPVQLIMQKSNMVHKHYRII